MLAILHVRPARTYRKGCRRKRRLDRCSEASCDGGSSAQLRPPPCRTAFAWRPRACLRSGTHNNHTMLSVTERPQLPAPINSTEQRKGLTRTMHHRPRTRDMRGGERPATCVTRQTWHSGSEGSTTTHYFKATWRPSANSAPTRLCGYSAWKTHSCRSSRRGSRVWGSSSCSRSSARSCLLHSRRPRPGGADLSKDVTRRSGFAGSGLSQA